MSGFGGWISSQSGGGSGGASSGLVGNLEILESNQQSAVYGTSGIRYIPLRAGETDYVKFQFIAATDGPFTFTLIYAMSVSNGGDVDIDQQVLALAAAEDPDSALPSATEVSFTPGAGVALVAQEFTVTADEGDIVRVVLTRQNDDTHAGDLRVIGLLGL